MEQAQRLLRIPLFLSEERRLNWYAMSIRASFIMKTHGVAREQGFGGFDMDREGWKFLGDLWTCCACSASSAGLLEAYFDEFHPVSALTRTH